MKGNITEDGIAKDLEWMQRVGIGGVQNFDAAMETPIVVDQRLEYMSPPWQQAFASAVTKADELGLEFAIASSAGWSLTGGPWVKPEDAMKKLVWSETQVSGGATIRQKLPQPPSDIGSYQTLKATYSHGHNEAAIPDQFYRDALVLAFPVIHPDPAPLPHSIAANGKAVDGNALGDDSLATGVALPESQGKSPGVLDIEYAEAATIQSAVMYIASLPSSFMQGPLKPTLQALSATGEWTTVAQLSLGAVPTTVSFPPTTAKKFRLLLTRDKPSDFFKFAPAPGIDPSGMMGLAALDKKNPLITDLRLLSAPKIDSFEIKAGFRLVDNYHELKAAENNAVTGINPKTVVDLTQSMTADGELKWKAPPGQWKILRLGYSLTGKTNSPASNEATGLEVDKLDCAAVERYLNTYLDMYKAVVGEPLFGKQGLTALLTDSTEAGPSNWTPTLIEQFKQLRGYDPIPWLPALTGEIVGSRAQSDAFLYDFRHTLAQLHATEHYGTVAKVAHERELSVYGESLEGNRLVSTLGDDLEMRRFADIPMAAMWSFGKGGEPSPQFVADMRGASSVAHIYGKPFAAAESLTSILAPWAHAPADLQPMMDAAFLNGINRPVIHTSAHQPVDDKQPGLSLHVFGQNFTRHETWAEMAKPWVDYLSRNSYLLQQGKNIADVAYFYGEEPPIGVLAGSKGYPQDVPRRYAYDFVPADAVLNEFSVEGKELVSRGGARYQVLYLGETSAHFMTLSVLKRIAELVKQGATLVGQAPTVSPSLGDDKKAFAALVKKLWREPDGGTLGKGKIIANQPVEVALETLGISPAFAVADSEPVQFVHRSTADAEIYYIANRGEAREFEAQFRVADKAPEIWRADSGSIEQASYRLHGENSMVPLTMAAWESYFVVFRNSATAPTRTIAAPILTEIATIDTPWQVDFQAGRGAPDQVAMKDLESLSAHKEPGIRYFSGVATYHNTFTVDFKSSKPKTVELDFGQIGDVAEVYVNGEYAGTAWKPPYRVAITAQIRNGVNQLEIRVANLWVNRLIGDRQKDATPVAHTTFNTYLATAPLRPAGLMGPVKLLSGE